MLGDFCGTRKQLAKTDAGNGGLDRLVRPANLFGGLGLGIPQVNVAGPALQEDVDATIPVAERGGGSLGLAHFKLCAHQAQGANPEHVTTIPRHARPFSIFRPTIRESLIRVSRTRNVPSTPRNVGAGRKDRPRGGTLGSPTFSNSRASPRGSAGPHQTKSRNDLEKVVAAFQRGAAGIRTRDAGFAIRCLRPLGYGA